MASASIKRHRQIYEPRTSWNLSFCRCLFMLAGLPCTSESMAMKSGWPSRARVRGSMARRAMTS
eukprot:scaffold34028_cov19-Tisochrysis_lutea.AAC.1